MPDCNSLSTAMTIAGSDSGGGAGIQADLKTFAALGVFGTSALTAITAQNPEVVNTVELISPTVVSAQIRTIGDYFTVDAVKTGMLASEPIITSISEAFRELRPSKHLERTLPFLVVDPVMVATSGAVLLEKSAIRALKHYLIPMATLITPNIEEACILAEYTITTVHDMEPAARILYDKYGVPTLVKGGHMNPSKMNRDLPGKQVLISDCLFDGTEAHWFERDYIPNLSAHGTGCTLSAAITAFLMQGCALVEAVQKARDYLQKALEHALLIGCNRTLNHQFSPLPLIQPASLHR